jgi:hypothetical protein
LTCVVVAFWGSRYTEEFKSVLQGCPNTVLTPHIGGSTEEAQTGIGVEVSNKLIKYVNMGPTTGSVNVPNVDIGGELAVVSPPRDGWMGVGVGVQIESVQNPTTRFNSLAT